MAINGSFYGTTSNSSIKPKITWSAEENIEGNYSDVTATLSYSRTDSYMTYGHWAGSLSVGGDTKSVSGKYVEITKNSNTVTITHTVRVPHNDDGTGTVTISASGAISGTTLTKTTITASVTLTDIPRAASIAATDADIGSVSVVTIGRKSDIYTYTVAYQFGSLSGYLSESGLETEAVFVTASSLAFPVPESFYYEIPEKASDSCTLTCTTFLDGSAIGQPRQCSFSVRADPAKCAPVLSLAAEDVDAAALALTADKNTFIRYVSHALCTLTAQARYGAQITQRKLNGEEVTADTVTLEGLEADTLQFTARDSRGYTGVAALKLKVLAYFAPSFRLSVARTDATSGDAAVQAEGSFYNGSFGAVSNSLQLQYQVNGGEPVTVSPEIEGNTFRLSCTVQDLDYTQSHQLTLTVSDALSTASASVKINPGIPVFEWGKEDFRFHVPVFVEDQELLPLVEQTAATCVSRKGDTMQGDLSMGGMLLRDLGTPLADTDAVTRAYADSKLAMVKLWENGAPTSTFAPQELSLDLSAYSMVLCLFRWHTGSERLITTLSPVPGAVVAMAVRNGYIHRRSADFTQTAAAIEEGIRQTSFGSTAATAMNDTLIPMYIYGIKGVSG